MKLSKKEKIWIAVTVVLTIAGVIIFFRSEGLNWMMVVLQIACMWGGLISVLMHKRTTLQKEQEILKNYKKQLEK